MKIIKPGSQYDQQTPEFGSVEVFLAGSIEMGKSEDWLEVETEHLFSDQFNTAPIQNVSENGVRIMIEDVVEIKDDVRDGVVKCQWCYGYDKDNDGACDKCGKTEYLKPLNPRKI